MELVRQDARERYDAWKGGPPPLREEIVADPDEGEDDDVFDVSVANCLCACF